MEKYRGVSGSSAAIADLSPLRASEVTSFTPLNPRPPHARRIEEDVRAIIQVLEKDVTVRDLLDEARETECLSGDVIDLAHAVRKCEMLLRIKSNPRHNGALVHFLH